MPYNCNQLFTCLLEAELLHVASSFIEDFLEGKNSNLGHFISETQTDRLKSDNRGMNEDGRRLGQKHLGQKFTFTHPPTLPD